MKRYLLIACFLLSFEAQGGDRLDPFSVYRLNAPKGCVDETIGSDPIGLPELIQIGICNNPTLNRDYMNVKAYEARLGETKAEYLPSLTGTGSISDDFSKVEDQKSGKTDPYSGNLALSWLLYDFGGRTARTEQAKAYLDSQQFTYNASLHDTVLSITQGYFDLLSAEEVLKSSKTAEQSYRKSYEESVKRYELGLVSASDKLLAQTSWEQSKLDVVKAENTVQINQGSLAQLLNLPPDTTFSLTRPPKDEDITKLETDLPIQELIEVALANRPEIKSQKSSTMAAKQEIEIVKAASKPSLSFGSKANFGDDWKYGNPYEYGTSIGLNLSIPLFTGFSDTYKIAKAKYQYQKAKADEIITADTVKNEVWNAFQNYHTAVSTYEISQKMLESAKENERVAFVSYQIGKGSILNLLTASSQLATARQEVIVAFYSVLISKSTLYRAIGRF